LSSLCLTLSAHAQQAIQWRVQDGGNGHWYAADTVYRTWASSQARAVSIGGHLATISGAAENAFVLTVRAAFGVDRPWLGGYQDLTASDYSEPAGGWRWVDGTPWQYTHWGLGEPNNQGAEHWLHFGDNNGYWNDLPASSQWPSMLEWDADCNHDDVVDYGQILSGQLVDLDSNGVPDCCEAGTGCCVPDFNHDGKVSGGDLGQLLLAWGPNPGSVEDLNGDGTVDGVDLSIIINAWGPCP
jgi:hypothetical protein